MNLVPSLLKLMSLTPCRLPLSKWEDWNEDWNPNDVSVYAPVMAVRYAISHTIPLYSRWGHSSGFDSSVLLSGTCNDQGFNKASITFCSDITVTLAIQRLTCSRSSMYTDEQNILKCSSCRDFHHHLVGMIQGRILTQSSRNTQWSRG